MSTQNKLVKHNFKMQVFPLTNPDPHTLSNTKILNQSCQIVVLNSSIKLTYQKQTNKQTDFINSTYTTYIIWQLTPVLIFNAVQNFNTLITRISLRIYCDLYIYIYIFTFCLFNHYKSKWSLILMLRDLIIFKLDIAFGFVSASAN